VTADDLAGPCPSLLYDIDDVLSTAKVTLGFAFVDDLIAVYKPLPEAHEGRRSER